MSADPRSSKHHKSCRFEIKSTQPGYQIYVTIDQSLATCWPLLCLNGKENQLTSSQFEKRPDNVITMHAGRGLYTLCAGNMALGYKTNFISLEPALAFQTLTLSLLGKWATTHERVFFLGKNCSWTSLPGST